MSATATKTPAGGSRGRSGKGSPRTNMHEFGRREVTTPVQVFLRSQHLRPLSVQSAFSSFDAWRRNEGANRPPSG